MKPGDGRVVRIVRVVGSMVWISVMWTVHCLCLISVLGATCALYTHMRATLDGAEPPSWREFSQLSADLRRRHPALSIYAAASTPSSFVLFIAGIHHPGLAAGVFFGWGCALSVPTLAVALACQQAARMTGLLPSAAAVRAGAARVRPVQVGVAAVLHPLAWVTVLCLPHQVIVIGLSVVGSIPALIVSTLPSLRVGAPSVQSRIADSTAQSKGSTS